jgi:transcriptional regulator with XRE-family HTH domain
MTHLIRLIEEEGRFKEGRQNHVNTQSQIAKSLRKKKYREAFVRSQINIGIPFQVRALREKRPWNQKQLAEAAGMLQPRISAIERPGGSKLNLETLLRLAAAFDVGLIVRFASFSEMVRWADEFSPDSFEVPSFADDMKKNETSQADRVNALHSFWDSQARIGIESTVQASGRKQELGRYPEWALDVLPPGAVAQAQGVAQ